MNVDFTMSAHWSRLASAAGLSLHKDSMDAGFTMERWVGTEAQAKQLIDALSAFRANASRGMKTSATRAIQRIECAIKVAS